MRTIALMTCAAVMGGVIAFSAAPVAAQDKSLAEQWLDGELEYAGPQITYDGPTITVDIAHFLGAGSPLTSITERAIERMEAETDGKLKARMFYNNSLHDAQRGGFEGVAAGISDMSTCYSWINPGGFSLQLGLQLPGLVNRATPMSHAIMQLYGEYFREDYEAQGVLFARATTTQAQHLLTRDEPIRSLEDLEGKRILASGAIATKTADALGAVPVPLTVAEYYSGFQQGVVDVMALHDAGLKLFRMDELARARTLAFLWANPIEYCMNADFFYGLPDDLQEYFHLWLMRVNHAEAEIYFDGVSAEGVAGLAAIGVEETEMAPEDFAALEEAVAPVTEQWIAEQEAEGRHARQFVEDLKAKIAELEGMTDDELFMLTYEQPYPGLVD
jgi:TRAP-type C4-dicarboxylate transport system substrate-binding protein